MTETLTIDRTSKPKPTKIEQGGRVTVSASALALHLDCSRAYIGKLEAEGVIPRQGDGFPLDQSRVAYLRYLRRERQRSPRSEADAAFQQAKTELIRMRIAEKQRTTIPLDEAIETTDRIIGLVLTAMSGMAARIGGHDLALRRRIEQVVFEVRTEIADAAHRLADTAGEPREEADA